jgi:formate transporter FocA
MADGQPHGLDALLPAEIAARAEAVGVRKAHLDTLSTLALAVLAGAFISLGAVFATVVGSGPSGAPWGLVRLAMGLAFSLGLILVIVGGAELFTGNTLIVMAWAGGGVSTRELARNWALVYLGNLLGALGTAMLVFASGHYRFGNGQVGATMLSIARSKLELDPVQAVALGILCNGLVCLAVWLSMSARTTADRVLAIVPPIAAFVAAGFEHSIANMYFVPVALLVHAFAPAEFWATIGSSPAVYASLSWSRFALVNLVPVTIGNIIGGAVLVGGFYWFIYLRGRRA